MDKVFYLKDFQKIEEATKDILKDFYPFNSKVLVKIHFGEPGNKTAFTPKDIEPLVKAMESLNLTPIFIDTPVKYNSPRNSVEGYQKAVKEKGFDKLGDFIISDNYIKISAKDFEVEVCRELVKAENVLIVSHVKGHPCSGFGGAIKNLGMGGVSKKSKEIEHTLGQPVFVSECSGCGTCAKYCPFGAITIKDNRAMIDLEHCGGCSICQEVCPSKCLIPKKANFDDLLAQGASAVINNLPPKTFYINYIKNITQGCDCPIDSGKIIAEDMGVVFSKNPVAIDKASVDLINQKSGHDVFRDENNKNPLGYVNFASIYTGYKTDYQIEGYNS
jgi:hypothetical protein